MEAPPVRLPAVAGRFYSARVETLSHDLDEYLTLGPESATQGQTGRPLGCVVPHAGYMYSGHVAGAVYSQLPPLPSYIILGPNHFGRGAPLAMMSRGAWRTPLGEVPLDTALGEAVRQGCHLLVEDPDAHQTEHSLEVQVPFLQRRVGQFGMLPIAVGSVGYAALESLGRGVAHAVKQAGKPVLIVASSDMNHYEPDGITREKDHKAIDRILALDPEGLYDVLRREDISMCGYGPAIAMLTATTELGADEASLVKYATSADTSGDRSTVVGYAGIIVYSGKEQTP
jgi:MEMO1 family protein